MHFMGLGTRSAEGGRVSSTAILASMIQQVPTLVKLEAEQYQDAIGAPAIRSSMLHSR